MPSVSARFSQRAGRGGRAFEWCGACSLSASEHGRLCARQPFELEVNACRVVCDVNFLCNFDLPLRPRLSTLHPHTLTLSPSHRRRLSVARGWVWQTRDSSNNQNVQTPSRGLRWLRLLSLPPLRPRPSDLDPGPSPPHPAADLTWRRRGFGRPAISLTNQNAQTPPR